jgi:hypothetical protein
MFQESDQRSAGSLPASFLGISLHHRAGRLPALLLEISRAFFAFLALIAVTHDDWYAKMTTVAQCLSLI